jgi:DNA-binding winged helix-turn-helix (wHTH) protein
MSQDNNQFYNSAGLLINISTGEVAGPSGQLRLSPVNSRVLNALLQEAEKAVSRQQLFDRVWPNQVVSDDALTRSISDLRSQLKSLSTTEPLIETIPKVGYRWKPALETDGQVLNDSKPNKTTFWAQNLKPMLVALVILMLLLWSLLGWLYYGAQTNSMPLIILPTAYSQDNQSANTAIKTDVADCLKQAVMQHDDMQYLSSYALDSHAGSPFPYYSHEFGVRWFIESQLSQTAEQRSLTLNLIDARTALVMYSQQHLFNQDIELEAHCQNFIAFVAEL